MVRRADAPVEVKIVAPQAQGERGEARSRTTPPATAPPFSASNTFTPSHVIHFDRWWNPVVQDQPTHRGFRIGQSKNVPVHKFVCVGTLEERMDALIRDKKALASDNLGSGDDTAQALTGMGVMSRSSS